MNNMAALKMAFHKRREDLSFKKCSLENAESINNSKSFKIEKSNESGSSKVRRTLDGASMDLQSLLGSCNFVWTSQCGFEQNMTALAVLLWAAPPWLKHHPDPSQSRRNSMQLQCQRSTTCLVEIPVIDLIRISLHSANLQWKIRAEMGLRFRTCH